MAEYSDATTLAFFLPPGPGQTLLIGPSSFPSLDTVASVIGQISSELNAAALVGGYQVPVLTLSQDAYRQMQLYTHQGAGAWVLGQMFPQMGGPNDRTSRAATLQAAYQKALSGLRDGSILLSDAPRDEGGQRPLPQSDTTMPAFGGVASPIITRDLLW